MPLNGIPIGDTIAGIVKSSAPPPGTPVTDAQLKTMWEQIMTAIYADINATAVVLVASVSGVTTGGGVSGPGAGTIL